MIQFICYRLFHISRTLTVEQLEKSSTPFSLTYINLKTSSRRLTYHHSRSLHMVDPPKFLESSKVVTLPLKE